MFEKLLESLKSEDRILPNRFTIAMGKRVREARLEAKMSQAELAQKAYFKQSSISKIESGNKGVAAEDILYLSFALDKPISYFFPEEFRDEITEDDLSSEEKEMLMLMRKVPSPEFKKTMEMVMRLIKG